jgi:ABC-type phosphate transport system substrate-binding protein
LAAAPAPGQELVANASVAVANLSRNDARLYFTMRVKEWPDGTPVRVFVLADEHPLHQSFAKTVLGLFPYQLRRAWDRQVFSGTGQAPVRVDSAQALIERVAETPGAIGYAEDTGSNPGVRVMEVH